MSPTADHDAGRPPQEPASPVVVDRPGRRPFGVFVSYRRDDTAGHAGRLFDKLAERFGGRRVFMDINTIQPGVDFRLAIDRALRSSSVLLVIIGRRWLNAANEDGTRRLDDPTDLVRVEIATALSQGMDVIPVLVQRASVPATDELPEDIRALRFRHAIEIDDARWDEDVDRLVRAIGNSSGAGSTTRWRRPLWPIALVVLAAALGLGAWLFASMGGGGQASTSPAGSVTASTQPTAVVETPSAPASSASPISSADAILLEDDLVGPIEGVSASNQEFCDTGVGDALSIAARGTGRFCITSTAAMDPAVVLLVDASVEVDATFRAFTETDSEFGPGDVAIVCRMVGSPRDGDYYVGSMSPAGHFEVNRFVDGLQGRLDSGSNEDLVTPIGQQRHLRFDCEGPAAGTTVLTLSIDGHVISRVIDPEGLGGGSVGLGVTAYWGPEVEASFLNLVIRTP